MKRPRSDRRVIEKLRADMAKEARDNLNLPEITMRLAGAHGLLVVAALAIAHKVDDSSKLARALVDVEQARDTLEDINRAIEMIGIPVGAERSADLILGKGMVLQALRNDVADRRYWATHRPAEPDVDDDDDDEED